MGANQNIQGLIIIISTQAANRKTPLTGGAPGASENSNRRTSMASAVTTYVTREQTEISHELPQNAAGIPYTDVALLGPVHSIQIPRCPLQWLIAFGENTPLLRCTSNVANMSPRHFR